MGTRRGQDWKDIQQGNDMWEDAKTKEGMGSLRTKRSPVWLEHRAQRRETW